MASLVYRTQKGDFLQGQGSLTGDAVNVMLLTSSYTPSATDSTRQDVSSHEVSGTGYDAAGKTLSGKTRTKDNSNDEAYFDAADVTWSSSTITARYAVLYYSGGTLQENLICCIDFGSDQSSTNGDFKIEWNTSGILALT
jgi:hypothetical protein